VLTDDLRGALRAAADEQPFQPDLSGVQGRVRRLRRRRLVGVSAGITTATVVAVATAVLIGGGADRVSPSPADKASAAIIHEVENWGPTRGNFADDSEFLDRVRHEWSQPSGDYYGDPRRNGGGAMHYADGTVTRIPADRSRHLTGSVRILYAGQTLDGPAAVVAQRTTTADVGMFLGIMLPTSDHDLRLMAAYTVRMYAQREFGDRGFDTDMVSFTTDIAGNHLVVLPADPADDLSVSMTHSVDTTGRILREWTPLPTQGGVATLTATKPVAFWDTLIRVSHDNEVIDEGPVWHVLSTTDVVPPAAGPPEPENLVDWPLTDQGIAGAVPGGGYPGNLDDVWLTKYAGLDAPYGSRWLVSDSPGDRHPILVEQLWFYGDPAHTVVLRVVGHDVQLLSDTVTDPRDRPLVFLSLPDELGWLVVAGPDADITGYREAGTQAWSDIDTSTPSTDGGKTITTRKSAFIPSTARHLQVRLEIEGKTRVVDSPSG
jgi:hypothetical protein